MLYECEPSLPFACPPKTDYDTKGQAGFILLSRGVLCLFKYIVNSRNDDIPSHSEVDVLAHRNSKVRSLPVGPRASHSNTACQGFTMT